MRDCLCYGECSGDPRDPSCRLMPRPQSLSPTAVGIEAIRADERDRLRRAIAALPHDPDDKWARIVVGQYRAKVLELLAGGAA